MLYEVITSSSSPWSPRASSPANTPRSREGRIASARTRCRGRLPRRPDAAAPRVTTLILLDRDGVLNHDSPGYITRITSYNVCYTKLLRMQNNDFAGRNVVGTWGVGMKLGKISFIQDLTHDLYLYYVAGTNDKKSASVLTYGTDLTDEDHIIGLDFNNT